jgi:hypothetical protein
MGKKLNRVRQVCRAWHRDLGYFLIGACIIYGLSGMALSLRRYNVNFLCVKESFTTTLPPALSAEALPTEWRNSEDDLPGLREVKPATQGYELVLRSGTAHYNTQTGSVTGSFYTPTKFLTLLHRLHFNREGTFKIMGILFGFALLFLAVSGAIIVAGKKSFMRRGLWFMLGGIALVVLLALITF